MGSLILDPYYSTLVLKVEINMLFKSILLFLAMLVGGCYGSCNRTISGYTWKFNATIDKDFSSITKEECAEKCLSLSWCKGYTWSLDDSSGSICHIFHELKQQHACQECSKCFSGVFKQISGVCSTGASNIIGIKSSSSEMSCIEMCAKTSGCKYYSWGAGNIFSNTCFLFKACSSTSSCEAWQSGRLECVTNPNKVSNAECSNYEKLTDATRKGTHGKDSKYYTDRTSSSRNSPDWKGPGWYRVVAPAGTKILSGDPGYQHCNTDDAGYINNGTYPTTPGQSTTLTVCYNAGSNGNCDQYHRDNIAVTLCNGFYVYKLTTPLNTDDRYCTE